MLKRLRSLAIIGLLGVLAVALVLSWRLLRRISGKGQAKFNFADSQQIIVPQHDPAMRFDLFIVDEGPASAFQVHHSDPVTVVQQQAMATAHRATLGTDLAFRMPAHQVVTNLERRRRTSPASLGHDQFDGHRRTLKH